MENSMAVLLELPYDPAIPLLGIESYLRIQGYWFQDFPMDTKIHRYSSPLYKMAQYLHKAYTRPSAYFKSPLDYL